MSTNLQNLGRGLWSSLRERNDERALWLKHPESGAIEPLPAQRLQGLITHIAIGLLNKGVQAGSRVLIHADASPETLVVLCAVWTLGAVTVHVSEDTSQDQLGQALGRMNADWIVVDNPNALGELELAGGDAVSRATTLFLHAKAPQGAARTTSYPDLETLGRKRRDLDLDKLARNMMSIPPDARAAIFYWPENDTLAAEAVEHRGIIQNLVAPPASWGLSPREDTVFASASLRDARSLYRALTFLFLGHPMALPIHQENLREHIARTRPTFLITSAHDLHNLLQEVDQHLNQDKVRGTLRRGLGWLERKTRSNDNHVQDALERVDGWLEKEIAKHLPEALGGSTRWIWCKGSPAQDTREVLQEASIKLLADT